MMAVKKLLVLFCILALTTLACGINVDLGTSSSSTPTQQVTGMDQVSTMVAQTLQALTQTALAATPANTPTPNVTPTPTNTPVSPTLSVSVATNCYAGPSTSYGFVITIYPGTTVTVVGKDTGDNYWIIDVPGYPGTLCWLSGQYASVNGDTSDLPAPATTTILYGLSEPTDLRVSCNRQWQNGGGTSPLPPLPWPPHSTPWPPHGGHGGGGGWWGKWTVALHWKNTDSTQTGVLVYRNGDEIASLGGGANSYTDKGGQWDGDITYGVQAVNSSAVSSIATVDTGNCR